MNRGRIGLVLALLLACGAGGPARAAEPADRVQAAIEAWVRAHTDVQPTAVEVPELTALLAEVPGAAEAEVEVRGDPEAPVRGALPLTLVLRRDGVVLRHAVVTARVHIEEPVWVAARNLPRGSLVSESDVRQERLDVAGLSGERLASADRIVGRRTTRSITAGTPWRGDLVEEPPLVRRNDIVRLRFAQGALRIEARGRAKEDGRAGELVRVQNVDTRREIMGRVAEDGALDVEL